ncbi:hypothetical protein G5714_011941 [Onychostoma macrolepis]|uniref:Uncharacterized protein n=2 Tax=Onychostoma macrolepis TaxID=369639 RepID=A0A7J6CJR8_9TELE|nr:hypothetical protein G5714_011941 [Onychostoma macrolepis]
MKTSGLISLASNEARFPLAKAKLQRLSPSVQCSNDSMTLRIPGPRTPHFLVDRGEALPVPLSEMPASCGFSLKRVRRDVSLVAPYKGCHVRQQGGSYILTLIIMGDPVQMSCPVSPRLPAVSCSSSGMTVTLWVQADDIKVKVDGSWQPLLPMLSQCSFTLEATAGSLVVTAPFTGSCWEVTDTGRQIPLIYGDQEVTLFCPLTRDPDMQQMSDPFPFGKPWWYPPYHGVPATLPPTVLTTTTPFQYPIQQHLFPHMNPRPIFDPYFYPKGGPAPTPAQQPQYPWYPKFPPMYGFQNPVEVTTPATTPAPYQPQQQYQGYPMYSPFYGYQPIKSFEPPAQYPFKYLYPKDPIFVPRSPKSVSSAQLSSVYGSRRQTLN